MLLEQNRPLQVSDQLSRNKEGKKLNGKSPVSLSPCLLVFVHELHEFWDIDDDSEEEGGEKVAPSPLLEGHHRAA